MTKRLYAVSVDTTVFVVASSPREAERAAVDAIHENDGGVELMAYASREPVTALPRAWRGALPYGDNDEDRTCEDWMSASSPAPGEEKP